MDLRSSLAKRLALVAELREHVAEREIERSADQQAPEHAHEGSVAEEHEEDDRHDGDVEQPFADEALPRNGAGGIPGHAHS